MATFRNRIRCPRDPTTMTPRMDHGRSKMKMTTVLYMGTSRVGTAFGKTQFQ
jgi:hypothetical protein